MSKGSTGTAIGGLIFATLVGALGVAAAGWFGMAYHYGGMRHEVAQRVLATAEWRPERVDRDDADQDCSAGNLRLEAERLLGEVGRFELSKIDAFIASPTDQRARELSRTVKGMTAAVNVFDEAYGCRELGRIPRDRIAQQQASTQVVGAVGVLSWTEPEHLGKLRRLAWVGRDIQATGGLYEFAEGAAVMDTAYMLLGHALQRGELDPQLDALQHDLRRLIANEESAQLHWRAGARILLADLLGPDWDAKPPTPLRARDMMESIDGVLDSLDEMPDLASRPYAERYAAMQTWVEREQGELSGWDPKFKGFGSAGLEADRIATLAHARGRALLIASALRQYRRRFGRCPRALDDLTERGMLEKLPVDPFTDAPFAYDPATCEVSSGEPPGGGDAAVVAAVPR